MLRQNEKGSTLVMVLLIVVVITILGAALFTMNMSASKQFTNKEEQVQARHLAEMGVVHYKAKVEENVREFNGKPHEYEVYDYISDEDGGTTKVLNVEETQEKYIRKICKLAHLNKEDIANNLHAIGNYEVERIKSMECEKLPFDTPSIKVIIESTGHTFNNTKQLIEANVVIKPKNNDLNNEKEEENEQEKDKPTSNSPATGGTTDWTANKIRFETKLPDCKMNANSPGFTEDCMTNMVNHNDGKRWNKHFGGSLISNGSTTLGFGAGERADLEVEKDWVQYDSINIGASAPVSITVKGNLITLDETDVVIGDNTEFFVVCGDALFSKAPRGKTSSLFVLGEVYEGEPLVYKANAFKPDSDSRFDFKDHCPLVSEPPSGSPEFDVDWKVKENVNPVYRGAL